MRLQKRGALPSTGDIQQNRVRIEGRKGLGHIVIPTGIIFFTNRGFDQEFFFRPHLKDASRGWLSLPPSLAPSRFWILKVDPLFFFNFWLNVCQPGDRRYKTQRKHTIYIILSLPPILSPTLLAFFGLRSRYHTKSPPSF